jgi:hypothetical protein
LLELAAAHHPLRLIGAGMLAGLIGCVDADGAYRPRTPTHHLEHAALVLLQVPELWDEWVQPDRELAVADWAAAASGSFEAEAASGSFEAEATSVERLTRERVFDDPHARLSAQQWYWYDPVLVEAELERHEQLLGLAADDIAEVVGVPLPQLSAVMRGCFLMEAAWARAVVGEVESPVSSVAGVKELRRLVVSRGTTMVPAFPTTAAVSWHRLASLAKVPREAVSVFLDLFALAPGDLDPAEPYLRRLWRLRERPVVVWDGVVIVPAIYDLGVGFRPRIERLLKERCPRSRYAKQRGPWVEERARALLDAALRPDELWRSLKIGVDAGHAPERDGLLIIDSVALAIEVKGGGLPPSARAGDETAQRGALERLLRDATAQAASLASAIRLQQRISGVGRDDRRRPLELPVISRVLPMVVTLEDVSGVTSRTQPLARLFPPERVWQIALDELDWYARTFELPAELLHYALTRPRLERENVAVLDEGDWFRIYVTRGPAQCLDYLDALHAKGEHVIVHTGNQRRGHLSDKRPVWRSPLQELLRSWDAARPPGWLEASFALLALSDTQARELPDLLAAARRRQSPGAAPMLTMRPAGDHKTALHILLTRDIWALDITSIKRLAVRTVPDAGGHVMLAAPGASIDDLAVGPILAVRANSRRDPWLPVFVPE